MKQLLRTTGMLAVLLLPLSGSYAAEAEAPEEIVVVGRQPGPPLWKVSNGDKVLWIFPYLSDVPKDMIWETDRVERVIAESQESISRPIARTDTPDLFIWNPVNLFRGYRLMKRVVKNPDGGTLEENLAPELYARFAALKAQYFPRNDDLDDNRPLVAGDRMTQIILEEVGLVGGGDILDQIRRLTRRNRDMQHTVVEVSMEIEGGFRDIADRVEQAMASLSPEQEQTCFEQSVRHMEEDLEYMKSRASSWARGYVDEFRNIPLVGEETNSCLDLVMRSSEQEMLLDMAARVDQVWLAAAEKALATNQSTFAVLDIDELLSADGLLSQLKAKGYEVREP
jgi:hypothetical protein